MRGEAKLTDCIFKLKEKVKNLAVEMYESENREQTTADNESESLDDN